VLFFAGGVLQGADPSMASLQEKLAGMGFYRGEVDGVYGSQTAAAIRRYQLAKDLRVTGLPTKETLISLGLLPPQPSLVDGQPAPPPLALQDICRGGPFAKASTARQSEVVRAAQRQLKILGHFTGSIDGIPSPSFTAALKTWQQGLGLRATGRLDRPSVTALQLDVPTNK